MKIELTRSLKIRLLQALSDGILETNNFPELDADEELTGSIPIEAWLKRNNVINASNTSEQ